LGDSPAALVEESAATASSLADQAQQLSEPTAAFKVAGDGMMAA
jgi:methyl-accepting chemotaxis protein-1 (serine sensor receptor)